MKRITLQKQAFSTWSVHRARDMAPLLTLAVMVLFFSVASENFLNPNNLINILAQISTLAIAATGVTFVLLCAEIDLSIASVGTMTGVVAALLFGHMELPGVVVILLGIIAALCLGLVNGLTTAKIGLPSFIVTLATMKIAEGLGQYFTKGKIIYTLPPVLETWGSDALGSSATFRFPLIIFCGIACLALGHFVLTYTRFGRYVYMTGSNREAARLSGINVKRIVTACLAISAATAGLAGMLNTGRLGSAQGHGMESMLLDTVSAVVLGGTSLFGGEGGIKNTVMGLLIFGILNNGLNLLQLDIFIKEWIQGLILLIALIINIYALRLSKKVI